MARKKLDDSYKQHWCYKEITKNWKITVKEHEVIIWYDKKANVIYARFTLESENEFNKKLEEENPDDPLFKYEPVPEEKQIWFVHDEYGDLLNDYFDYNHGWANVIGSILYYFHTRY